MTCAPEATWDVDCSDCRCPLSTIFSLIPPRAL